VSSGLSGGASRRRFKLSGVAAWRRAFRKSSASVTVDIDRLGGHWKLTLAALHDCDH
jgi:hypothetical protein